MLTTLMAPGSSALQRPKLSLSLVLLAWKTLLFIIAITSPGEGYDTSTSLLEPPGVTGWLGKFVRWDAIYFVKIAQRGYLFEQEWAFGWGWTTFLAFCAKLVRVLGVVGDGNAEAAAGVAIAHLSHWGSVIVLHELSKEVFDLTVQERMAGLKERKLSAAEGVYHARERQSRFAFVAAALHIFSPAGMFLSAVYAESLFSLLQFLGYYCYVRGHKTSEPGRPISAPYSRIMMAGFLFALATTVRSNGLLSGALFAYDGIVHFIAFLWIPNPLIRSFHFFYLVPVTFASLCLVIGASLPQYLAYREYCLGQVERRSWCNNIVPSIYTWVQGHYWNNGFLRYWTISNIPLFILAAPILVILIQSGLWLWMDPVFRDFRHLSIPQLILAALAVTNYHVQIITRLSSGYPVWYWWLASSLIGEEPQKASYGQCTKPKLIVRWMVMYALVQGGLFASFLPPA